MPFVSSDRRAPQRGILNGEWIARGKRPDGFKSRRLDYRIERPFVKCDTVGEFGPTRLTPEIRLPGMPQLAQIPDVGTHALNFLYSNDTVGELSQAADQPESGQDGGSGVRKSRFPDGPDEFANSIKCDGGPFRIPGTRLAGKANGRDHSQQEPSRTNKVMENTPPVEGVQGSLSRPNA